MEENGLSGEGGATMAETRQMEVARLRNLTIQKKLKVKLAEYQREFDIRRSRLRTEQRYWLRSLSELTRRPGHTKTVIIPRGLSEKEVKMMRESREEQTSRSLTLNEFDERLKDLLEERKVLRTVTFCKHNDANSGHQYLSPNTETQRADCGFHFKLVTRSNTDIHPTTEGRMPRLFTSPLIRKLAKMEQPSQEDSSQNPTTLPMVSNPKSNPKTFKRINTRKSKESPAHYNPLLRGLDKKKKTAAEDQEYTHEEELEDLKAEVNFPPLTEEESISLGYTSRPRRPRPHTEAAPAYYNEEPPRARTTHTRRHNTSYL